MKSHRSALSILIVGTASILGSTLMAAPPPVLKAGSTINREETICQISKGKETYSLKIDGEWALAVVRDKGVNASSVNPDAGMSAIPGDFSKDLHSYPKPDTDIDSLIFDIHGNFYFRLKDGKYANPFTGEMGENEVARGGPGAVLTIELENGEPEMVLKMANGTRLTK